MDDDNPGGISGKPVVVVVGPCASGKTTLVTHLRQRGVDARACGQEHSQIHDLWSKRNPDILIALSLDLATLRARRSPTWPESIFAVQRERLQDAYAAADVVIDTAALSEHEVVERVMTVIREWRQLGANRSPGP